MEEAEAKLLLYEFLRDNISFTTELFTGVKLFPFQHMAIKSMMQTDYFLGIWGRGMSKSFSTAIFAILDAIMNQGVQIGIISKSFRQCIEPNALVFTQRGLIKAKELRCGDFVHSEKGQNKILNKWENEKAPSINISTKSGYEVGGKLEHRVLCLDTKAQSKIYKNLEDIEIGDVVAIQTNSNEFPPTNRGFDDGYFYGSVMGDGCVSKNKYGYVILTTNDQQTIDFVDKFAKDNDLNSLISKKRGSNCYSLRINNKKWIKNFFFDLDDSLKAHQKELPDSVLGEGRDFTAGLLSGLFDTDGCAQKDRVELASSSLRMIKQVQILLLKFGIVSKIQKEKARGEMHILGVKTFGKESYKLRITGLGFIRKFNELIGFKLDRKKEIINKTLESTNDRGNYDVVYGSGLYLSSKYKFPETLSANMGKKRLRRCLSKYQNRIENDDIIKLKELTDLYWDKVSSIESGPEIKTIDIEVDNEHCYTANGFVNHNSKMIFKKIEDIAKSPKAAFMSQCITRVSKMNDEWTMEIGRSKIIALPLGDGEKLRGFRFQRMIIDELLLMPEKIFNEVIMPFLSVVENPTERQEVYDAETQLIATGDLTEEERTRWPNNKIIGLSSASYKFEYLYKLYQQYEALIMSQKNQDGAHRVIMHFSYDCAPEQLYDRNLINQSKSTMSQSQFDREFEAIFTDDSSGYFKVSKMAGCTLPDGEGQCVEVIGDPSAKYILAFDPSWSESESSDDFAMLIIKIHPETRKGTIVHSYAVSGTSMQKHIKYMAYLLNHFNIEMVIGDYNGGVQFLSACNESATFKKQKLKVEIIDAEIDNVKNYEKGIRKLKRDLDKETKKFVFLRKPSSSWIRVANEGLQAAFDHKRIFFAGAAMDDNYNMQRKAKIPIKELKFLKNQETDEANEGAKMIDFVEHQRDMMDLIKVECALVQVTTSPQGTQSFDLPLNLRKQRNADKARKDSYSALILGHWGMNLYFDIIEDEGDATQTTFTPMFIS